MSDLSSGGNDREILALDIKNMHIWVGLSSCIILDFVINFAKLLSFDSVCDSRLVIIIFWYHTINGEQTKLGL